MADAEPCAFLAWDSEFWGFPIAQVVGRTLHRDDLPHIDTWTKARSINCLYFLASFNDPETLLAVKAGSYQLVDARITLMQRITRAGSPDGIRPGQAGFQVRPAVLADIEELRRIAAISYHDSRFYFDHNFPRAGCDEFYARWITESYHGFADVVLVAASDGAPVAYITGHLPKQTDTTGHIGLVGVAPQAQGQGVGRSLISQMIAWFAHRGVEEVTVATQGRNIPAQALYQACGFRSQSLALWHHKWIDQPAQDRK